MITYLIIVEKHFFTDHHTAILTIKGCADLQHYSVVTCNRTLSCCMPIGRYSIFQLVDISN